MFVYYFIKILSGIPLTISSSEACVREPPQNRSLAPGKISTQKSFLRKLSFTASYNNLQEVWHAAWVSSDQSSSDITLRLASLLVRVVPFSFRSDNALSGDTTSAIFGKDQRI